MKRTVTVFLILSLTILLAACGESGPAQVSDSPTPAVETAAPTPTPALAETEVTVAEETAAPKPAPTLSPTPAPSEAPAPEETPDWEALGGIEYAGKARGYGGNVNVTVVLDADGKILNITVGQHWESDDYGDKAIAAIPNLIVERQSLDVDAVSGATFTSEAIVKAVSKALIEAGLDPADYGYVK